jgi:hypothetical protein
LCVTSQPSGAPSEQSGLSADLRVPVVRQRTWKRKWRDVQHDRDAIAEIYNSDILDVDNFMRRIESFSKTCHELGAWIEATTGKPAKAAAKSPPALELCYWVAEAARLYEPPTPRAEVENLIRRGKTTRADITWTDTSTGALIIRKDALDFADECIAQWQKFFREHNLNPLPDQT